MNATIKDDAGNTYVAMRADPESLEHAKSFDLCFE